MEGVSYSLLDEPMGADHLSKAWPALAPIETVAQRTDSPMTLSQEEPLIDLTQVPIVSSTEKGDDFMLYDPEPQGMEMDNIEKGHGHGQSMAAAPVRPQEASAIMSAGLRDASAHGVAAAANRVVRDISSRSTANTSSSSSSSSSPPTEPLFDRINRVAACHERRYRPLPPPRRRLRYSFYPDYWSPTCEDSLSDRLRAPPTTASTHRDLDQANLVTAMADLDVRLDDRIEERRDRGRNNRGHNNKRRRDG